VLMMILRQIGKELTPCSLLKLDLVSVLDGLSFPTAPTLVLFLQEQLS
jgi:hypothetical protein